MRENSRSNSSSFQNSVRPGTSGMSSRPALPKFSTSFIMPLFSSPTFSSSKSVRELIQQAEAASSYSTTSLNGPAHRFETDTRSLIRSLSPFQVRYNPRSKSPPSELPRELSPPKSSSRSTTTPSLVSDSVVLSLVGHLSSNYSSPDPSGCALAKLTSRILENTYINSNRPTLLHPLPIILYQLQIRLFSKNSTVQYLKQSLFHLAGVQTQTLSRPLTLQYLHH